MLALFAEGIAGRPIHIKSLDECPPVVADSGDLGVTTGDGIGARHDGKAVYLPERIEHFPDDALNAALFRLATLDELGFREFGTYAFAIDEARRRLPRLAPDPPQAQIPRESDLGTFFHTFASPTLARALFGVIEAARVRAAVVRRYPGTRRYRRALAERLAERRIAVSGPRAELDALRAAFLGVDVEARLFPLAAEVLSVEADVYTSAAATIACYHALAVPLEATVAGSRADETTLEWLQREARLEDWEEELADRDAEIAAMAFAELVPAEEIKAESASGAAGELRDVDADLVAERDQLKRRIDMERSSVKRALGDRFERAASFRYDEWDYLNGVYLRGWCRLYEERLEAHDTTATRALLDAVRLHVRAARRQFEQVRPTGYQRVRKTPDGDEIDLDAVVQARADIRTGASPDERVYSRRERLRRDVGAVLLVDLSASTDDILPEERLTNTTAADDPAKAQDIRDPYFDQDEEYDFAARMAEEAAKRRIIDILRESVLLLGTALESLGDRYAIYGFSGYGRDCVEFYVAKEFDDPLDDQALDAIAAMKPKRSTRMGPAIRHAATKLASSGAALKVLMIVSDGFPQDHDYGPVGPRLPASHVLRGPLPGDRGNRRATRSVAEDLSTAHAGLSAHTWPADWSGGPRADRAARP